MAKFVYVYTGGQMAETPEEQAAVMQLWGNWFATLAGQLTDGGNPFGASTTVKSGGSSAPGTSGLTGYSIIEADSLESAADAAAGCPILTSGGQVEVYEALAM